MNSKIPEALAVLDIEIAFQKGKSRDERDFPTAFIKARDAVATLIDSTNAYLAAKGKVCAKARLVDMMAALAAVEKLS